MRFPILASLRTVAVVAVLSLPSGAQDQKPDARSGPPAAGFNPSPNAPRGFAPATLAKDAATLPPAASNDRTPVAAMSPEQENAFAFSLLRQLSTKAEAGKLDNAILCPGGVIRLLRALRAGAKGKTAAEIAKTLAPDSKASDTPKVSNAAADAAPVADTSDVLKVASALWSDPSYPFLPAFEQAMTETLGAHAQSVPLVKDPEAARSVINAWAAEHTGGNIQELLKPGEVGSDSRLVLTDAAWFKDAWKRPFKVARTTQADFTLPNGSKRNVSFVADQREARVATTPDAQALSLPFSTSRYECLCLLPVMKPKETAGAALLRFERGLKTETLTALTGALSEQMRVDIRLPKLDLKGLSTNMVPPLKALGVKTVFTKFSDLSGMTEKGATLKVGIFKQDTSFRLDESGAEATAATAAVMITKSAVLRAKPVIFHADRPCLFLVRDTVSGAIIFFIRCAAPPEASKPAEAPSPHENAPSPHENAPSPPPNAPVPPADPPASTPSKKPTPPTLDDPASAGKPKPPEN